MPETATWPETEEDLLKKIRDILDLKIMNIEDYEKATDEEKADGYNQSAEAMWKVALAAFEYAAGKVGASGFQASWSALKFYGEAMHVDCPYAILKAEDLLYPQYNLEAKFAGYIEEWTKWAREEAKKKLKETDYLVAPAVKEHWEALASGKIIFWGGDRPKYIDFSDIRPSGSPFK